MGYDCMWRRWQECLCAENQSIPRTVGETVEVFRCSVIGSTGATDNRDFTWAATVCSRFFLPGIRHQPFDSYTVSVVSPDQFSSGVCEALLEHPTAAAAARRRVDTWLPPVIGGVHKQAFAVIY